MTDIIGFFSEHHLDQRAYKSGCDKPASGCVNATATGRICSSRRAPMTRAGSARRFRRTKWKIYFRALSRAAKNFFVISLPAQDACDHFFLGIDCDLGLSIAETDDRNANLHAPGVCPPGHTLLERNHPVTFVRKCNRVLFIRCLDACRADLVERRVIQSLPFLAVALRSAGANQADQYHRPDRRHALLVHFFPTVNRFILPKRYIPSGC
jgi:hypothetical protein